MRKEEKKVVDLEQIEINREGRPALRHKRAPLRRKRRVKRRRQVVLLVSTVVMVGGLGLYLGVNRAKKQSESLDNKHVVVVSPAKGKKESDKKESSRGKKDSKTKITPIFARVSSLDMALHFLADYPEFVGAGFHQASNPKTIPLDSVGPCLKGQPEGAVRDAISKKDAPLFFVMASRGRSNHLSSAVDVVLKPGTELKSPVDGVVAKSEPYALYGRHDDWRLEIAPKEHPEIRVVMIHLDEVPLEVGEKVYCMKTPIGKPRALRGVISSQVDKYIPFECDHVHLQVNPCEPEQPPPPN